MGLGNVFVRSVVREIGRNYGKSISNNLLGDSHSTPVRVVGSYLGQGTGGRNYKHQLEKICKTWTIKGATATFNVAQNMYKCFFDLVEEAQSDGNVDVGEVMELMKAFVEMRPQLKKVEVALEQLDRDETVLKTYVFKSAYPLTVGTIELSSASAGELETFDCTWRYQHFEASGVNF